MSRFRFAGVAGAVVMLALLASARTSPAAEKTAAELLPPSTVVCVEINQPKDLISFAFDSPLRKQIDQTEGYRKFIDNPQYKIFQIIVAAIEQRAGVKWRQALETTTEGGVVLAFDAQTQGLVLLAKPSDPKTTDAVRDAFFAIARDDATKKGKPDTIEQKDYRGLTAYKIGDGMIANIGPYLMLTNKPDLAKATADRFLDGGASLADDHVFSGAHHDAAAGSTAWVFVRTAALRAMAGDNPLLDPKYKSDNPAAEFLLGGLLPVVQKAEYVTASLSVKPDDLKLTLAAPLDLAQAAQAKKFFFAPQGDGAAKPLRPDGTMLSVSMYRDGSALWQAGPDLFTDAVATQMAQAESGLSTFFGGKSFGTDVLGAFKPQIQFIAAKQDYKVAGVNQPTLKLPGFALVLGIKEGKFTTMRKPLRTGFQTAIALSNLDAVNKGRPTLELQTEKRGGADIQFATYDMSDKPTIKDDTYLNFSPALVMSDKYMMICSTKQIAEQLADLAEKQADAKATTAGNTFVRIDGAAVASMIHEDREPLIAQNMLDKGHDRPAAEKEIDTLAALVGLVQDAELRLTPSAHAIQLEVEVKTAAK